MKIDKIVKKLYWKWEESHIKDTVHWAFFLTAGILIVIYLVSTISSNVTENNGFGVYSSRLTQTLNEE